MKKSLFFIYFLSLILFTHQRLCTADLSHDLRLLNGQLGTLKIKLAELSTALQKLKNNLNPKSSPDAHPIPLKPPSDPISIPLSAPIATSEYTPEEFQKLFASAIPIPTLDTPPALTEILIEKYTEEEINDMIQNLSYGRSLYQAKNNRQTTHIKANTQNEHHTCGYHALCNAIHFFNYFLNKDSLYSFPHLDDLKFFNTKFSSWRRLVLSKTTEMVKTKKLNTKKDIADSATGDLDDIIFDIIREGDSDVKKIWESGSLIFYPYSRPLLSILSLDVKKYALHYERCIKKFSDKDEGILIWILGQDEHYYTLCVIKNNKKYHFFTCDSLNKKDLTQKEIPTLGTLNNFCRSKQSFQQFYVNKIFKEIEGNNISIEGLFRQLQDNPELIAYLSTIHADIKKPIATKLRNKIPELSGKPKPDLAYDLIPINKPEQRKARALYVLIDFFEKNAEIEKRVPIEGFQTDAIYYLHYKDELTATMKPKSTDLSDYCFKKNNQSKNLCRHASRLSI